MTSRDQYDRLIAAYVSAHETGDADALGRLFTEDAVLLDPGHPPASGRRAIQGIYKEEHLGDGIKLTINVQEFHCSGDLACSAGTFEVEEGTGNYLEVLRRQSDGSFVYHRICWNWH